MAMPKFKVDFTQRDLGWGHIKKEMEKMAKKPFVKIGIQGESAIKKKAKANFVGPPAPSSVSVVDIATIHEFGAPSKHIPERSFLRSTMDRNMGKYKGKMAELQALILDPKSGMTTEKALGLMGMLAVGDVKATIKAGISPALAESTIRQKNAGVIGKAHGKINQLEKTLNAKGKLTKAQKGAENKAAHTILSGGDSTPLIDTGQMINSLTYKVDMTGNLEGQMSLLKRSKE